ncbi:MAG: FecR domain-containing protein [Gammaproteobacteria bacterium]|nr:FecR domain-containing protein [Gammaproteobacteria bacterium]
MRTTSKNLWLAAVIAAVMLPTSWLITPVAAANLADNARSTGYWQVKRGDTLYSIARQLYPNKGKQQARLRKALVRLNENAFPSGKADSLSAGARLKLPRYTLKGDKPLLRAKQTSASLNQSADGGWKVKRGQSLSIIARRLAPGNKRLQENLVADLLRLNPSAFAGGKVRGLRVGALLTLPSYLTEKSVTKPMRQVVSTETLGQPVVTLPKKQSAKPMPVVAKVSLPLANSVGRVLMTTSVLQARRDAGALRSLNRNSRVYVGDTLITGSAGTTQLRMKDGALLALRPSTEFKIEEYRYEGSENGRERSFFRLLRGGFRTITGAVGHLNKSNYRVATRVATIGIRGTHYGLQLCDSGCGAGKSGLYGGVVDGSIVVSNDAGEKVFNNDEYFHVATAASQARPLLAPPGVVFDADMPASGGDDSEGVEGIMASLSNMHPDADQLSVSMLSTITTTVSEQPNAVGKQANPEEQFNSVGVVGGRGSAPVAGSVALAAWSSESASGQFSGNSSGVQAGEANGAFSVEQQRTDIASGQRVDNAVSALGRQENRVAFLAGNALLRDTGLVQVAGVDVGWGRWQGDWRAFSNDVEQSNGSSVHYVYGSQVTTADQLRALSGTVNYTTIVGGTLSTAHSPSVNTGQLTSVEVEVDFGAMQIDKYEISADFMDSTETLSAQSIAPTSLSSAAQGGLVLDGNYITATSVTQPLSGSASVNFVGAQAQGLLSSYALAGEDNAYSGTFVATAP